MNDYWTYWTYWTIITPSWLCRVSLPFLAWWGMKLSDFMDRLEQLHPEALLGAICWPLKEVSGEPLGLFIYNMFVGIFVVFILVYFWHGFFRHGISVRQGGKMYVTDPYSTTNGSNGSASKAKNDLSLSATRVKIPSRQMTGVCGKECCVFVFICFCVASAIEQMSEWDSGATSPRRRRWLRLQCPYVPVCSRTNELFRSERHTAEVSPTWGKTRLATVRWLSVIFWHPGWESPDWAMPKWVHLSLVFSPVKIRWNLVWWCLMISWQHTQTRVPHLPWESEVVPQFLASMAQMCRPCQKSLE
jgi:hypothetical protein